MLTDCIGPCPNILLRIAMLTWVRNFMFVMMAYAKKMRFVSERQEWSK